MRWSFGPDAIMPDLRLLDAYLGKKGPSVRSGVAHLQTKLTSALAAHTASGELGVTATGLAVRDGDLEIAGALAIALKIVGLDFAAHHADISGTRVEVRDVMVSGSAKEPRWYPLWWGRIELDHTTLAYGAKPRFHTGVVLQARDARPVLKAYAVKEPGLPSWAANLMRLEGLHGGASITLGDALVDVRGLHVVGGAFDIRGELQKRGAVTSGAALISSGPLALGIDLKNGSAELKLIDAPDWYRQTATAHAGTN